MNTARTIPDRSQQDVVTYDLISNGQVVDPGLQVMSIVTCKEINRIPTAKIVLRDGDAAEETFAISNQEFFIPGKVIEIKLGKDRDNQLVFKGIVTRHCVKVTESGQSDLVVECRDESVKLTIGRHSRYFENQKDSAVLEEIISGYGLGPDVEDTQLTHKELVQHHCTDWDLILSRADINGKLVMVDDGQVQIKAPDTSQAPTLSLLYGSTLLEFEADIDARTQWKSVKGTAWDYTNQRLFEADSESANFDEPGNISGADLAQTINLEEFELRHSGQVVEEELKQWTDACMLRSRLGKIRGRAKIRVGFNPLKPGQMVDFQGVGNRFNGKAFVTAVRHEVGQGIWDTHIQFGLCPKWFAHHKDILDFPSAGLLPGVRGLQIGKVVQLENDPDGEDRIKVKVPLVDNQSEGIWCRVNCLDAGEDRGTFFRPEIDDEVLVGFINDDPRDAVVLGMLNSSAKPAPLNAQNANHEKGVFTRSKMRIHFDDSTKTATIDTPAGNSIKLDESGQTIEINDQNQNSIKMKPSGIELSSPMEIKIQAGTSLTLAATTTLSIGGASVSAKADGPVGLEGATAKMSASGIAEISGSLVKIN